MLLTIGLLLASLHSVVQEAAAPAAPEPAQQPAQVAGTAAHELLARAQRRLYDIEAAGLERLSFSAPIRMDPPTGPTVHLGDVAIDWTVSADPQIVVTTAEDLPPQLAPQAQAISFQLEAQGQQMMRFVDNDIFSVLLTDYDATLAGPDGDRTKVHFEPKEQSSGAPPLDWFFDANDVPVMFEMAVSQGDMTMNISYEHTWIPASPTDESLILQQLNIVQQMGDMRNVITTTLDHQEIGGLVVLVGYTERGLTPLGDEITNEVRLEGLTVKGREMPDSGH